MPGEDTVTPQQRQLWNRALGFGFLAKRKGQSSLDTEDGISQGLVLRKNTACSMQVRVAGERFNRRFEARLPKATAAILKSLNFICM